MVKNSPPDFGTKSVFDPIWRILTWIDQKRPKVGQKPFLPPNCQICESVVRKFFGQNLTHFDPNWPKLTPNDQKLSNWVEIVFFRRISKSGRSEVNLGAKKFWPIFGSFFVHVQLCKVNSFLLLFQVDAGAEQFTHGIMDHPTHAAEKKDNFRRKFEMYFEK